MGLLIFFGILYLIVIIGDCRSEDKFNIEAKQNGLYCARVNYARKGIGLGTNIFCEIHRNGRIDSVPFITSCDNKQKLNLDHDYKILFAFYTPNLEYIMPIFTKKQYRKLQLLFPDSAAIMDTTYLQ